MLPRSVSSSATCSRPIKIKSPKHEIKLYKPNIIEMNKPELLLRGSNNQSMNDEMDKITQAWNKLKITALSKALAVAPDVGPCSLGPLSPPLSEPEANDSDGGDKPDLRNAVTSTPVKPKTINIRTDKDSGDILTAKNKSLLFDISEISPDKEISYSLSEEMHELENLRVMCLNRIEARVKKSAEKKKEDCLRVWMENDEKIKEKLEAYRIELDKERLMRIQRQCVESQISILETKASAQIKSQQLQQSKAEHDKRIAETNDKIRQIEQKKRELEEKQKQKREELKMCINGIYECQLSYNQKYNGIAEINKKCKDIRLLHERVSADLPKLKGMNELLLRLVEKSKEGKVSLKDLQSAQTLVQQISIVSDTFARHTEQINKQIEEDRKRDQVEKEVKAKQEEDERQQKVKEETKQNTEKLKMTKTQHSERLSAGVKDCISGECLKWHLELNRFLEDYEKKLQPLLNNDSLKNFRFDCQKVVNVPVNAISPLDDLHMEDKFYKLSRLLQGQAVPLGNNLFLATGHPLGVPFCTNLLAKKFVKQGELTVSSKPEAAFAIASVIVALWVDYPEFGRLLLAHFHRECPYLIPAFLPQVEGQSNEDYYKQLGYQYSEDGKVEPQDKFLRRMSGVMRLYAAIMVSPLKRSHMAQGKPHPHSMREGWRWFSATLNLSPRPDISPTLLFDFLEVAGRMMHRTYGVQFKKLLHLLCTDYFHKIEQVTPDGCGGPVVRLKSFLEKILKDNQVPPPMGLLPPNYW